LISPTDLFLGFTVAIAMDDTVSKQVFVDAGVLSLILAILPDKLKAGLKLENPSTSDISKLELSAAIRNEGMAHVNATTKEYNGQTIARWRLLLDASRVFLDDIDTPDPVISEKFENLMIDGKGVLPVKPLEHLLESE
jgi:hypothetical protein